MTVQLEGLDFSYDMETFEEALQRVSYRHPAITYRIDRVVSSMGWPVLTWFAPDRETMRAFVFDVYDCGIDDDNEHLAGYATDVDWLELKRQSAERQVRETAQ